MPKDGCRGNNFLNSCDLVSLAVNSVFPESTYLTANPHGLGKGSSLSALIPLAPSRTQSLQKHILQREKKLAVWQETFYFQPVSPDEFGLHHRMSLTALPSTMND